jgi:eukaryotic-like serine/threonine-protein kinase
MAATQKAKIPVGFVIAGKYRVTGELGRGGMAAVYEAENVDIGKRVAIKILAQELTSSTTVVERFLREARAVAAIRSPYICDVYDSGRLEDGRPFLVLELLEGESLYERMVRVGQIDNDTTVAVMTQACRGLAKAHSVGIVHRDLKPENLFLTKDEEAKLLTKVLDFGLAKFYAPVETPTDQQARLTREGAVFGTPAYMSPEQVRGQGAVDARADLWALGCITYECLTGRTVWATDQGVAMTFAQIANGTLPDPNAYRTDVPPSFKAWFHKALHKDINQRFQTPKEFAEELAQAMDISPSSIRGSEGSQDVMLLTPRQAGAPSSHQIPGDAAFSPGPTSDGLNSIPITESGQMRRDELGIRGSRAHFAGGGTREESMPQPRSASRFLVAIAAAAALAGGGYFAYRTYLGPNTTSVTSAALDGGPVPSASTDSPVTSAQALSHDTGLKFRPLISDAQEAIAKGDLETARAKAKDAVDLGNHHVPATFLQHLDTVRAQKGEPLCNLTGLARPRTYDLMEEKVRTIGAGRPTIVLGPRGPVMVWTEADQGTEQAFAVALDEAFRAKTAPFAVTPEGQNIQKPELLRVGDKVLLTYWDTRGPEAGVYARFLDGEGRIASSATLIARAVGGASSPTVVETPDKGLLFSWVEPTDKNTEELFFQKYNGLTPAGDKVRASAFKPTQGKSRVRFPVAAFDPEAVHLAFRLERDPERQIQHLRVPFNDIKGAGISAEGLAGSPKDRHLGDLATVTTPRIRADWPSLGCVADQCYIAWNDEGRDGIWVGYAEKTAATPLFKKRVATLGRHPAVGTSTQRGEVVLVWYDRGKILASRLDRDGIRDPSVIARVSSVEQPQPSVAAGSKAGEWLVAWLDYEGGHLEGYAARIECK